MVGFDIILAARPYSHTTFSNTLVIIAAPPHVTFSNIYSHLFNNHFFLFLCLFRNPLIFPDRFIFIIFLRQAVIQFLMYSHLNLLRLIIVPYFILVHTSGISILDVNLCIVIYLIDHIMNHNFFRLVLDIYFLSCNPKMIY